MSKTNQSRREFLTAAPAVALAATALPGPEPEAEEEYEYPHATGACSADAREALPEELQLLRCLVAARKAARKVLEKHGAGCDDFGGCVVCQDVKAALWGLEMAASMIDCGLIGGSGIGVHDRDE